jgi:hypothetical protein
MPAKARACFNIDYIPPNWKGLPAFADENPVPQAPCPMAVAAKHISLHQYIVIFGLFFK